MRSILDVFSRTWFINVILAVCVAFFGAKSIGVWLERSGDGAQTIQAAPRAKTWDIKKVTWGKMPPETAYGVVTDRNLFSQDRTEFVEEKKEAADVVEEDIKIAGRKIVLYGVVMTDDYRAALISDPQPKPPKRPSLWVKEGESIGDSNVVVSSIQKESITLQDGGKTYEVLLYDKDKTRKNVAAQKHPPLTVITTKRTAVARQPIPAGKSGSKNVAPQNVTKKDNLPEDGTYETIDTPFGKIKRRKK